ncbi:MAG: septum formation initiator family protein [Oscillospiraceae bacterium]
MEYMTKGGKLYIKKQKNGGVGRRLFTFVAVGAVLVYCAYSISSDKKDVAEKQAVLAALEEEKEALTAENASYASILGEDDERAYMERIAIEMYGYAYPSERRFYDTTRS